MKPIYYQCCLKFLFPSINAQVRTEVMKIEKSEEPVHKVIVELISRLHVTKLVMGITCMKSSSRYFEYYYLYIF